MVRQIFNAIEVAKYSSSFESALKIANTFAVPIGEVFQLKK